MATVEKSFPVYSITITKNGDVITIPKTDSTATLAVEISLKKNINEGLGTGAVRIYNLNPEHRHAIFLPHFKSSYEYYPITIYAGYKIASAIIFSGTIREACSYRDGADIVTDLMVWELGYELKNAYISEQVDSGVELAQIIALLLQSISDMADHNGRSISISGSLLPGDNHIMTRETILEGNSYDLLKQYLPPNYTVSFDGETLMINYVNNFTSTDGSTLVIDSNTGLLNTPKYYGDFIELQTIFEPTVKINSFVELKSVLEPKFNGTYKVAGYVHNLSLGSGAQGGNYTRLTLNYLNISGDLI